MFSASLHRAAPACVVWTRVYLQRLGSGHPLGTSEAPGQPASCGSGYTYSVWVPGTLSAPRRHPGSLRRIISIVRGWLPATSVWAVRAFGVRRERFGCTGEVCGESAGIRTARRVRNTRKGAGSAYGGTFTEDCPFLCWLASEPRNAPTLNAVMCYHRTAPAAAFGVGSPQARTHDDVTSCRRQRQG